MIATAVKNTHNQERKSLVGSENKTMETAMLLLLLSHFNLTLTDLETTRSEVFKSRL